MANERLDIARFGIAKLIRDGGLCVPNADHSEFRAFVFALLFDEKVQHKTA